VLEGSLELAEEAMGTRESKGHGPKFTQSLVGNYFSRNSRYIVRKVTGIHKESVVLPDF